MAGDYRGGADCLYAVDRRLPDQLFVAGPNSTTLPIYIYGSVKRGISPEINALCTLLILLSVGLIVLAQWMLNRGNGEKKSSMLPF